MKTTTGYLQARSYDKIRTLNTDTSVEKFLPFFQRRNAGHKKNSVKDDCAVLKPRHEPGKDVFSLAIIYEMNACRKFNAILYR